MKSTESQRIVLDKCFWFDQLTSLKVMRVDQLNAGKQPTSKNIIFYRLDFTRMLMAAKHLSILSYNIVGPNNN